MSSVGVQEFDRHLADLSSRVAAHAARPETHARLPRVIAALAAELPTKNSWTLSEYAGEEDPHGVQHLLGRAVWDQDAAAAQLRGFVAEHLGADDAVFVGMRPGT